MHNFNQILTPEVKTLLGILKNAGYEGRVVGGAVRDVLAGVAPKDMDIATTALPEVTMDLFQKAGYHVLPTGLAHGTITVMSHGVPYEITTLRIDAQTDGRHAVVQFTNNWYMDASRRDFTINAMSVDADGNLFDYFNGEADLKDKRVAFVGVPEKRIQEDYLRILRYFRFLVRLGGQMDTDAAVAMKNNIQGLKDISGERLWMEFQKILVAPAQVLPRILQAMQDVDIFFTLGIDPLVQETNIKTIRERTSNPVTLATTLLYKNHTNVFDNLTTQFKWSGKEAELHRFLVENKRKLYIDMINKLKLLELIVRENKLDRVKELISYEFALSSDPDRFEQVTEMDGYVRFYEENGIPQFPIKGDDLLAMGMVPGKAFGDYLATLKRAWINSECALTRSAMLDIIHTKAGLPKVQIVLTEGNKSEIDH
jgi:tRNA nucleotidyltransferase (CCA-adding enzyme)